METKSLKQINVLKNNNSYFDGLRLLPAKLNQVSLKERIELKNLIDSMLETLSETLQVYKKHIRVIEQDTSGGNVFELSLIIEFNPFVEQQEVLQWTFTLSGSQIEEASARLKNGFIYEEKTKFLQDFFIRQEFIDLGIVSKKLYKEKKWTPKQLRERLRFGLSLEHPDLERLNLFKDVIFEKYE